MKTTFKDLEIGQTFDFVDPDAGTRNSFYARCVKLTARTYREINTSTGFVHRIGTVKARVFHVGDKVSV
jgi:hypothetical protein